MRNITNTLLAALVAFSWIDCVGAAEVQIVKCFFVDNCKHNYPDGILISGAVVRGDADKFRDSVRRTSPLVRNVILRSNGGDVVEAMKIGRDVRHLLLETEGPQLEYMVDDALSYLGGDQPLCVENGVDATLKELQYKGSQYKGTTCVCASACFLIYVAGARRSRSYVGIHRVYLDENASRDLSLDRMVEIYSKIKRPIVEYLNAMGVPGKYSDIMLQTSSKEIYIPAYAEIMADFYGWAPEVEEWLIAKCNTISERQLEAEEKRALANTRIGMFDDFTKFIEMRDGREACIQQELRLAQTLWQALQAEL
jgi:hypothetical protein